MKIFVHPLVGIKLSRRVHENQSYISSHCGCS